MRRAVTLALVAASVSGTAVVAQAQTGMMGQGAMAPAGGVVNRAVTAFQNQNQYGPGWLYYGINAADRGLGYEGSYMTLGGFIPYAEDDLGGFWSADLRSHLSVYGGFFSNVGMVRKQFIGGTLLGVGVYWDYDGDQNQYPVAGVEGAEYGQFGHSYNQVGISGEWLTDYGNLRSNGYIPVGTTAYTAGAPGSNFYKNYVMCDYGLDAALAGADLEVGAYIPGLADWAGMISVGGYTFGNSRYDWGSGPEEGEDVVPWFGGVYTRLDMTFLDNWDFSLQYNNDSYFDSTGFARLTYRMGGSRRRNVPDQMEQPMMRNEHIVRAHQTPIMATNDGNDGQPWYVIHVDNSAPSGGDGSFERPFNTLAAGNSEATQPWDIVFVNRGTGTPVGYDTPFTFQADNQFLVGNGQSFFLDTGTCGLKDIATDLSGNRPVLSNPTGASIIIDGDIAGGAVISNFDIVGSRTGIYGTGNLSSGISRPGPDSPITYASASGDTVVNNVSITSTGPGESGVVLNGGSLPIPNAPASELDGGITFYNTEISDSTDYGVAVAGPSSSNFNLDFNGSIETSGADNIVLVADMTGGTVSIAEGNAPAGSTVANEVTAAGGGGIRIDGNSDDTTIAIGNVSLTDTVGDAISVLDDDSTTRITADSGSGISRASAGAAVSLVGGSPVFTYQGPITNARGGDGNAPSHMLRVDGVGSDAQITLLAPLGDAFTDNGDGILIRNVAADAEVNVFRAQITSVGDYAILVDNSSGNLNFADIAIEAAGDDTPLLAGVALLENQNDLAVTFTNLNIDLTDNLTAVGFLAATSDSNTYTVTVSGMGNTLLTGAFDNPAVSIEAATSGIAALAMEFASVVTGDFPGGNDSLVFGPTLDSLLPDGGGTYFRASSFFVDGGFVQGTLDDDVTYTPGTVTVILPP